MVSTFGISPARMRFRRLFLNITFVLLAGPSSVGRRIMKIQDLVFLLAAMLAADDPKDRLASELDKLQGEWVLVETADEKRTDQGDDSIRMAIDKKAVTMKFRGLTTNQGIIEIKLAESSTLIDMRLAEGKTCLGRYALDGDQLTFCFDRAGQKRPNSLTPEGTQWTEKWKRVKP